MGKKNWIVLVILLLVVVLTGEIPAARASAGTATHTGLLPESKPVVNTVRHTMTESHQQTRHEKKLLLNTVTATGKYGDGWIKTLVYGSIILMIGGVIGLIVSLITLNIAGILLSTLAAVLGGGIFYFIITVLGAAYAR